MTSRRIIYVLEPLPRPHGGVAIIYRHVEILMSHGFSAWVHLPQQPQVDFYHSNAAELLGNIELTISDIIVIPEILGWALRQFRPLPLRKLMFCQGHGLLPVVADPASALTEWGVDKVIASSVAIRDHLHSRFGLTDVPLLPCAVDPMFSSSAGPKKRQIAFMPRRRPEDAVSIELMFKRSYPLLADVKWVAIDNVPRTEVARILRESAVFLSLSYQESFGLPPLEAMASGCLVAGYHGEGGREYTTKANGWWAEAGDFKACIDGLAAAFAVIKDDGKQLHAYREAALATVVRYSPEKMETAVVNFWRHELGD